MPKAAFALLLVAPLVMPGAVLAQTGHAHGHGAHQHEATAFGQPGDPRKPARVVEIAMKEGSGTMAYEPSRIEVRKGEQIRFRLRNEGALDHELVLGTAEDNRKHAEAMRANPDMGHDDPNARRLAPGARGEILWRFDTAGTFDMSCLIPGHREAGMTGTVVVK